jgi:hypothetical protein
MANKNSFNIPALYKQVFGVTGVGLVIPAANNSVSAGQVPFDAPEINTSSLPSANIQSFLGAPIYEQIVLRVPATFTNGKLQAEEFVYKFPGWPLFDISAAWLIVKENVQGGSGSVKEFISQDDFSITIRGFLINEDSDSYPDLLLFSLWKVINAKKSLAIYSHVFNLLGIFNIIIQDAKFPAVEGYPNMQPFELNCISDAPVILEIKNNKTGTLTQ